MPQLNIHGDPLPATVDNEVRSALTTSKIQPTAAVVIHIEDPKYVSPKRRRRRHGISWGNARVTSHKIHVLRSHIANLGDRWNEVIKQNTIHESLLDFRVPHIVFQDDDPRALDLFLYIVHWNTRMLPQTLTLDELVHLAQLADRYDLNHILINYLDLWLAPHRERILEPGYEQWLYVAWQFGLEEDYLRLANHLTINCAVNAKGQLVPPTSKKPIQGIFPPNALCVIHAARTKALKDLLNTTQTLVREILLKPFCTLHSTPLSEQHACTARSSHGLQRYLAERGLAPNAMGTKHYMHSVEHLARVLTAPDIVEHMRQGREEKTKHDETCRVDVELRKRVIRTTEELSWAANRALIEQLRKNAARRGIPSKDPKKMSNRLVEVGWADGADS